MDPPAGSTDFPSLSSIRTITFLQACVLDKPCQPSIVGGPISIPLPFARLPESKSKLEQYALSPDRYFLSLGGS